MASALNFNTVWTSIFEPIPTFVFLERFARESVQAPVTTCPITSSGAMPPAS
jgi:hypothetical protein